MKKWNKNPCSAIIKADYNLCMAKVFDLGGGNMRNKRSGMILACFLFLAVFGSLASLGLKWFLVATYEPETVFSAKPADKEFYENASFFESGEFVLPDSPSVMVVPRSLSVAKSAAEAFSYLNANDYETVVLISSGPSGSFEGRILSSAYPFDTPYGRLESDRALFGQLAKEGLVSPDENIFQIEDGILGQVSFIKKYLPEAKVLPLVIDPSLPDGEVEKLSNRLVEISRAKRSLVLLIDDNARFLGTLLGTIDQSDKDARDVGAAIRTVAAYAKSLRLDFQPLNAGRGNAGKNIACAAAYLTPSTKTDGGLPSPAPEGRVDLLFVGDLMLDRYVRKKMDGAGPSYVLGDLAKEGFFSGYDIVSANLEGAVTDLGEHYPPEQKYDFAFDPYDVAALNEYYFNYFSIANNHISDQGKKGIEETRKNLFSYGFLFSGCVDGQVSSCSATSTLINGRRVALLSFSMVYRSLPEAALLSVIKKAAEDNELVVVNVHWGLEYEHYPAENQRRLASKMAGAGADLIIGHHPHVVQGVEIIGKTPVFYSLGNFVFDQFDSFDTQEELTVAVSFVGERMMIEMIPLRSEKIKLRNLKESEAKSFFNNLAKWSFGSDDFKEGIRNGMLEVQ